MKSKTLSLLITGTLFCSLLLILFSCGESKREKRWRENRIRDSLATVAELDSAYQVHELVLDTIFAAMNKVGAQGADPAAFDYEPKNPWADFEWQLRGFTGFFVPKSSELKTSEIVNVLELEMIVRGEGVSLVRPASAKEKGIDHVAEALFLVKDRRQSGRWSEEARKDQKREVLAFLERLPKYTHIRLIQHVKYTPPKLAGSKEFEPGEKIKRYFFFDIRKSEIVGHYYVSGTNSMTLFVYGNTQQQELEEDLDKNFHNNELDAANKLTSSLVPPFL